MICFIYPFRDREAQRVKRSLDSLAMQSDLDFRVEFVDYGSREDHANAIKELVQSYSFANYTYHAVARQPWNKCRALNSVVKKLIDPYCFVADVDMIFHPDLVSKLKQLQDPYKAVYFKVGFLDEEESAKDLAFDAYQPKFLSDDGATGLTLFPTQQLKNINGFDEFYHFWGSEDTDVHVRLRQYGCEVGFYDQELLMLHQWHKIYRAGPTDTLTAQLRVKGIERINYQYLKLVKEGNGPEVNPNGWGNIPSVSQMEQLQSIPPMELSNELETLEAFIAGVLPNLKAGAHAFVFKDLGDSGLRSKVKGFLGKKQQHYLDLKEVNDRLLLAIIATQRHRPYSFEVDTATPSVTFRVLIAS